MTPAATQQIWTTSDYALIVSLISLCFAVASFVWNVWSKFILPKGKLVVMFDTSSVEAGTDTHVRFEAVNFGPTDLIVIAPVMPTKRKTSLSPMRAWWTLQGGTRNVVGGKRLLEAKEWPVRVSPGESISVEISISSLRRGIEKKGLGIGFMDTFSRFHEIPKKGFVLIKERVDKIK